MAIKQGHPTVYDLSEGKTEYRYVRGKGVVLFANHGGELYSLRLQKSAQPKSIDKISSRSLAQGETTLVSATVTSETNITGNYVATVTGGTGIDSTGATTGEDIDHTLSINIDGLSALGGTGLHQTQDHFLFSDNGTEKKITFSNLQDAVLDFNVLTTETAIVAADYVAMYDTDGSHSAKITHSNLLDTIAGTVGTTGLDRSGDTLVVTDLHPVGVDGSDNQLLTDRGNGTINSEGNLTFSGSTLTVTGNITVPDDGDIGSVSATDAIQISSAGIVTLKDDLLIKDGGTIGTATDADAITIAAAGAVTFSQRDVHSLGITIADGGQIGSASDADAIAIAAGGDVTFSQDAIFGTNSGSEAGGDAAYSNGIIGSSDFASGFTGGGWRLLSGTTAANEFDLTLDNLVVRGTMSVYELVIQQIRATNGSIIVSSSGKVESVDEYSGGSDNVGKIVFESTVSGTKVCPFVVNDIIMMQRVNIDSFIAGDSAAGGTDVVSKKVYLVTAVTQNEVTTGDAGFTNDTAPTKGDEFVRIGSTSDANRRGILYLTSDDTNAPFIDVKDGVDSYANWHSTDTTKVRVGKLSGITDRCMNTGDPLTGYGMYANNIFLKGEINSTTGLIGSNADGLNGWSIAESRLSSTDGFDGYLTLDGTGDYVALGSTTDSSDISLKSTGAGGTGMTICGWIYFPTLGSGEFIFVNNTQDANWSGINIYKTGDNKISILWGDGSGSGSGDYERMQGDGTFAATTWTFFAITTDFSVTTTDTKIWLGSGSTLTAQTVSNAGGGSITSPVYGTGTAAIGREVVGTDGYATFRMKKIAIWNEELSSAEVTALFNGGNQVSWGTNIGNYTSTANLAFHSDYTTGSKNDLTGNIANATITLEADANIVDDNQVLGLVQANKSSITDSDGEALSSFYAGASDNTGASAAISFGSDGKIRGNGIYVKNNIDYLITASRIFGNGSDGALTLSSSSQTSAIDSVNWIASGVLLRDIYCTTLTINASITINTGGYRIFVRDTLQLVGTGASFFNNGLNGDAGSHATSGSAGGGGSGSGAGGAQGSLLGGVAGGAGGAGGAGQTTLSSAADGSASTSITAKTNCVRVYTTNDGARGGDGADGAGSGANSATRSGTASSEGNISITNADLTYIIAMRDFFTIDGTSVSLFPASGALGGGGGGGGGIASDDQYGGGGGGGGQAGGSGGHVMIVARQILPAAGRTLADLTIQAKGGDGGQAGRGASGASVSGGTDGGIGGAGAGGNGGDGGCITLITGSDPGTSGSGGITIDVDGGAAGATNTGGSGNIGTVEIGEPGTKIICHV